MMSLGTTNDTVEWWASDEQQDVAEYVNQLLKKVVDDSASHSGARGEVRHPVCVQLRVTPCSNAFEPIGPEQVAFSQNLSTRGASLLLSDAPVSGFLRIQFGNDALLLQLFWKRKTGNFYEVGGEFVARV